MPVQPVPARSRAIAEDIAMSWSYDWKKKDHDKKDKDDYEKDYDKKDDYEKDDYEKDYEYGKDKKRRHCS
jgi:hypothetical protein